MKSKSSSNKKQRHRSTFSPIDEKKCETADEFQSFTDSQRRIAKIRKGTFKIVITHILISVQVIEISWTSELANGGGKVDLDELQNLEVKNAENAIAFRIRRIICQRCNAKSGRTIIFVECCHKISQGEKSFKEILHSNKMASIALCAIHERSCCGTGQTRFYKQGEIRQNQTTHVYTLI
ncbi:MAG: hypothetical protein EZS28_013465 [Streblomastix strix]|uniref:Uncharacterized protein n=1 Tax=Streblomastix strix TaxID=222440 RepID=A0A5J4W8R1_9EUKA|nr:MAG: hypothetical protein EZS28_013465 [Streblomastix strix]